MALYDLDKKDSVLEQRPEETNGGDSEDLLRERRAFRLALGILALLAGVGLVVNALPTLLGRWIE